MLAKLEKTSAGDKSGAALHSCIRCMTVFRSLAATRACPDPLELGHALESLSGACSCRRTGVHFAGTTASGCARRDPPIQCDKLRDRARSFADVRECGLLSAPTVDHAHRSRTINRVRQGT